MDQDIRNRIIELSNQYEDSVLKLRREIHGDPELSFKEIKTAQRVKKALEETGLTVREGIAKTGLIADLQGRAPGKTLLLRADMDALPLMEENDLPFRSANKGVMHACGHDVHTANLVGVAKILNALKTEWEGTVRFVFQPAEESGGGGREMIREGILDDIPIDASMALHTMTTQKPGRFSVGFKNVTSYSDRFQITVHGKKTHSAQPQNGTDAIHIAAHIIVAVNSILTKNINPMDRATYSFGMINGGTAPNIIPDLVEMTGMMRNVTSSTREILRSQIKSIAEGIASAMGGSAEFNFFEGYSSVYNDPEITNFVAREIEANASQWLSDIDPEATTDNLLLRETEPILGAEDYGFYTQRVPSCFYRVATGDTAPAHSSKFMVQEKYIKLCTRSMASLALSYLMAPK